MGQRKRIGIFFSVRNNWIGGTYYWLNWVNVFKTLPNEEMPTIIAITNKRGYNFLKAETSYPYLEFKKFKGYQNILQKTLNAITLRIIHKRLFLSKLDGDFDALMPVGKNDNYSSLLPDKIKINWIPDFQYAHMPEIFSDQRLVFDIQSAVEKAYLSAKLMLSSNDALQDFRMLFPISKAKVYVQHFTVTHPDISAVNSELILKKYGVDKPYFFSPNQFWAHKNHKVVIDAIYELTQRGNKDVLVLFSGKEWDDRNPHYAQDLKDLVKEKGLEDNVKFLGFLDRKEQLVIMKESIAVIQPSLFEGWSTVIEDALALNKFVIASNINVNKEQLLAYGRFFDPFSPISLANAISQGNFSSPNIQYDERRRKQAYNFLKMIED